MYTHKNILRTYYVQHGEQNLKHTRFLGLLHYGPEMHRTEHGQP